uniref:Uncharacterized protein AlNc14C618G12254 n=1 Tax=Albugo laibachii Nc14 TaxID=890382 RepID=F0X1G3_9STRA|nr:conserved hypothetical protein [Albugo laibachii Nc14]|eukprot:CCA27649.1 conserved hypothetical protein [Albugo laibachii Nc14]
MTEQDKVTPATKKHNCMLARNTPAIKRKTKSNPKTSKKTLPVTNLQKYARPATLPLHKIKKIKDKKLRGVLELTSERYEKAAIAAAKSEILLSSQAGFLEAEGLEKTFKMTQSQLTEHLDQNTIRKHYSLEMADYGAYRHKFTRNGRSVLLGSQKGHVAMLDSLRMSLTCEFYANELIRDVSFLQNNSLFSVAQKKYIYIYDNTGAEAHCIRSIQMPQRLEYLPFHFLLSSVSGNGVLAYHDITDGKEVAVHPTKQGFCDCMAQNPWNAVIHLGHANGIVSMWTPNMREAVVKMQCHQGPIRSLAIDPTGKYMVTAGADRKVKVFDLRKYQHINETYLSAAANNVCISQKGLVAAGFGPHVRVFKNAFTREKPALYMTHLLPGSQISGLDFQPYEDIIGIGHSKGYQSIIIPGAGEPNFDTFAANPYENSKQRNESEVHSLLEKIRPEMISLHAGTIGSIDLDPAEVQQRKVDLANRANNLPPTKQKNKMRGRNRPSRRVQRKQQNVIDVQKVRYREMLASKANEENRKKHVEQGKETSQLAPASLNRFLKR